MLSIWTSVIFFWDDHGNIILTLPTKVKRTYICYLEGKKSNHEANSTYFKVYKEKAPKLVFMCNRGESRFWDQIFPQAEFAKDNYVHGSIDWNSRTSSFEERGTDVGSQAPNVQWSIDQGRSKLRQQEKPG